MPFVVPVEIKESELHGKGVYAAADIKKGSLMWTVLASEENPEIVPKGYTSQPNLIYNEADFKKAYDEGKITEQDLFGGYPWEGYFIVLRDGMQYTNHNAKADYYESPTGLPINETVAYAAKDIKAGEEILDNYESFGIDDTWVEEFMKTNCKERYDFEKSIGTAK